MSDLQARLVAELDDYERAMPQPGNLIDALRAVVELHPIVSFGRRPWCEPCARPWPCSTIQTIARELGVDHG